MVRTSRPRPVDLVAPWPHGATRDPAGRAAAGFAMALRTAMGDRSTGSVAADCGLNHQTLHGILDGVVWPDMYTIAKLEHGLRTRLWPEIT